MRRASLLVRALAAACVWHGLVGPAPCVAASQQDSPADSVRSAVVTAVNSAIISPFLTFSNLIQFDNRSGNLGLQSHVRWTIEPGNDLFVVGQGWVQDFERGYRFRRQDSRLATKLQYTFRF